MPDYQKVAEVESSAYRRIVVVELLDQPKTPTTIAEKYDFPTSNISRAIKQLRDMGYVELLVAEDTKKGRLYGLTNDGKEVARTVKERQE